MKKKSPSHRFGAARSKIYMRLAGLVAVVSLTGLIGLQLLNQSSAAVPGTQAGLVGLVENVPGASIYRYGTRDSQGSVMDTLKIIANPGGGYLAVYHTGNIVKLSTSTDLKNWTFRANLDAGTQPTIAATSAGGFVVAHEGNSGSLGFVRFLHYPNLTSLYAGKYDRLFNAPRTLTSCSEGTPNITSISLNPNISNSVIRLGFHYHNNCDTDREAAATLTNFSSWQSGKATALDNAVMVAARNVGQNIGGNIGDRDVMTFGPTTYAIIEGQFTKGNFGTWRPYLYNFSTGQAQMLSVKTHKGSRAFANPTFTALRGPDGTHGVVVTMFVPGEGAAAGEGGPLVYYVRTSDPATAAAPAPAKPATPAPRPAAKSTPPPSPSSSTSSGSGSTGGGSTTGNTDDGVTSNDTKEIDLDKENSANLFVDTDGALENAAVLQEDGQAPNRKAMTGIALMVTGLAAAGGAYYIFIKRRKEQALAYGDTGGGQTGTSGTYNTNDEFGFGTSAASAPIAPVDQTYGAAQPPSLYEPSGNSQWQQTTPNAPYGPPLPGDQAMNQAVMNQQAVSPAQDFTQAPSWSNPPQQFQQPVQTYTQPQPIPQPQPQPLAYTPVPPNQPVQPIMAPPAPTVAQPPMPSFQPPVDPVPAAPLQTQSSPQPEPQAQAAPLQPAPKPAPKPDTFETTIEH